MENMMVNWVQGMNVSASHFTQTENSLAEMIFKSLSLGLNEYSYGLMPMPSGGESLLLTLRGVGEQTKVVLTRFYGVVKDGVIVEFDQPKNPLEASCELLDPVNAEGWDVVLTVSPFDRVPCGSPNMEEQPPRYPFVEPSYKLNLVARQKNKVEKSGAYSVVVGFLRKSDDSFFLDSNFIAPSLTMGACEDLRSAQGRFSSYLRDIRMAISIVLAKSFEQVGRTPLVNNIILISQELFRSFSHFYFEWENTGISLAPYRAVVLLNHLSEAFRAALAFMPKAEKEEMLNYFKEWIGVVPSSFEQMIEDAVDPQYSHMRIGETLHHQEIFLKNVQELFVALSHLEQIGGRKKEEMVIYFSDNQSDVNKNRESWLSR